MSKQAKNNAVITATRITYGRPDLVRMFARCRYNPVAFARALERAGYPELATMITGG